MDLGGTKIQVVVVDESSEVAGQSRRPTPTKGGPKDVASEIAGALRDAAQEAGVETSDLEGIGVGSPGKVDDDAGTVAGAKNLPGWGGSYDLRRALEKACGASVSLGNLPDWEGSYPLGEKLEAALAAPIALSNDVNVATQAEFVLGAAKPFRSLLGVFWGTGVGGGIVLDGRPWIGRDAAGEIGHVVVRRGGALCGCGRRGCMEAYAGRASMETRARRRASRGENTVLFEIMEEKGKPRLSSGIWERALERDDKLAHHLIKQAVEALGVGIASSLNLLDVEAVVIGGGLGLRLGDPYVEKIREAVMPHLFADHRPPEILLASLGDLGGAIGATLLAADKTPATA